MGGRRLDLTRRGFLNLATLAALGAVPRDTPALQTIAQPATAQPGAPPGREPRVELSATRVRGFADPQMDFQFLRIMGAASYGGSSIGECLATAAGIQDGVPASWAAAFTDLAQRLEADARARAARGHRVSARDTYLRASSAYRAAEYYTSFLVPQHQMLGLRSRATFIASMRLQDHEFAAVRLPLGRAFLPAYFLKPRANTRPSKTILVVNGFDGTLEEDYFYTGRAALERGYNVLHFCGPGQMDAMRFYPDLPFVPDFERVTKAAVDYLLSRPDVDPRRLALAGYSMGGYFSVRSAAAEPRLRAVIPSSPILDLYAYMAAAAGIDPARLPDDQDFGTRDLNSLPLPASVRHALEMMLVRFGQPTFKKTFERLRAFAVGDEALAQIKVPSLALIGATEGREPLAQFERFKAGVRGPVASHVFTFEGGGDNHTQVGNFALANAVIFDWLDEVFG
ncbi:MAG: prolyl oligopeptidase family serine peptidase [Armatimonadetes bacterium]|nr:prolyl oligopeptidase family serine peptidase [Armatimonadota bacterium]